MLKKVEEGNIMNYIEALELATKMHKGQFRKVSGEEAISHPLAVANKFTDENYKIVAILHDTIEDTSLTIEDLREIGLDESLILAIDILTKKQDQTYLDYILQCKKHEITKVIKIEDLKHNLSDNPTSKCSEDRYLMALYILNMGEC